MAEDIRALFRLGMVSTERRARTLAQLADLAVVHQREALVLLIDQARAQNLRLQAVEARWRSLRRRKQGPASGPQRPRFDINAAYLQGLRVEGQSLLIVVAARVIADYPTSSESDRLARSRFLAPMCAEAEEQGSERVMGLRPD